VKSMQSRKRALESRTEWLNDYLKRNMETLGISFIKNPIMPIKLVKNQPSVDITDESLIPGAYCRYDSVKKVDKKGIASALKAGDIVDGCKLKHNTRLKIG